MPSLLVAAFGREGLTYVRRACQLGMDVRVLDCFDKHHPQLLQWYGDLILQAQGRRTDVRKVVAEELFDVAIVHEEMDFIRTALITQSLSEAGVGMIIVVVRDAGRRAIYRRCGAHRVVVANHEDHAWMQLRRYLPAFATA